MFLDDLSFGKTLREMLKIIRGVNKTVSFRATLSPDYNINATAY